MREWVGVEKRFYPHVALHDFEAWLLPYWEKIKKSQEATAKPRLYSREGGSRNFSCPSVGGSLSDRLEDQELRQGA